VRFLPWAMGSRRIREVPGQRNKIDSAIK